MHKERNKADNYREKYADTFPLPRKVERLRPKHQRRMLFYPCSQISLYGLLE